MSVISFLNDLGIIPNKGSGLERNQNLLQGQKFKDYERKYLNLAKPHLLRLQQTLAPRVSTITEAMQDLDSSMGKSQGYINSVSSNAENIFNQTMAKYSQVYKTMSDENIKKQKDKDYVIDTTLTTQLDSLNKQLIDQAKQINNDMENMRSENSEINKTMEAKREVLGNYIQKINEIHKKQARPYDNDTLVGQQESTQLVLNSNYYLYLFLMVLSILILFFVFKVALMSDSNNSLLLIILISLSIGFLLYKQK
jgi:hypothetical protein